MTGHLSACHGIGEARSLNKKIVVCHLLLSSAQVHWQVIYTRTNPQNVLSILTGYIRQGGHCPLPAQMGMLTLRLTHNPSATHVCYGNLPFENSEYLTTSPTKKHGNPAVGITILLHAQIKIKKSRCT